MKLDVRYQAFFALVRAGLWERDVQLLSFEDVDYNQVYNLAEEQSVVGLVTAGIEHVVDFKIPKEKALLFVSRTLQLEQRNLAMNEFVVRLVNQLRDNDVYPILVKGQGVAQCYERPLWRSSGDVDLLLDEDNYKKAKKILVQHSDSVSKEYTDFKHIGMTFGEWVVELHGTLHCRLSKRIDKVLDKIQDHVFMGGEVQVWSNAGTEIYLPAPDNDVLFLFTHILKHFYQGGIGLRQICDWCRFLWTYRYQIDQTLLEHRLREMGIMSEWKAFASYSVHFLGLPKEASPMYSSDKKWLIKAKAINSFVMEVGNFGNNRDNSYARKCPLIISKSITMCRRTIDSFRHFFLFPVNSIKAWLTILISGIKLI